MVPDDHNKSKSIRENDDVGNLYIQTDNSEVRPPITWFRLAIWILIIVIFGLMVVIFNSGQDKLAIDREDTVTEGTTEVPRALKETFATDFSQISVDPSLLLSGGPGKNGIPALFNPEFESLEESKISDTTRGILVERNGEKKFYPYNILVWHEIVNDEVGGDPLAITFCPLCGSAVVYNRIINGEVHEFRVSGLLYESNMIMYDNKTESFFSQSIGEGVAGQYTGVKLQIEQFQLLELFEVKRDHPDAMIMTTDTGHSRDYTFYPYGNYDNEDRILFPVQHQDDRYDAKELFYIVPLNGESYAIRIGGLDETDQFKSKEHGIIINKNGSEVIATDLDENLAPGYYEMWFSWATQHPDTGVVIDPASAVD